MGPRRILIVDDDPALVDLVALALRAAGYETFAAYDGDAGLHSLYEVRPDLVMLDIMMPGHDGWEVCRRIREMGDVPIIMLTAKHELTHRLRGLNLGADDYVSKPFDTEELVLRVQAVLRRAAPAADPEPIRYDDGILRVEQAQDLVTKRGRQVPITTKEMNLLLILLGSINEVVPADELIAALWPGNSSAKDKDQLKVYISSLRRKIEDNSHRPRYIVNRRGVGYCFQSRDHQAVRGLSRNEREDRGSSGPASP